MSAVKHKESGAAKAESTPIAALVKDIQLVSISCREISAKIARDVEIRGTAQVVADIECKSGARIPLEAGKLYVRIELAVNGKTAGLIAGKQEEFTLVTVNVVFDLVYTYNPELTITESTAVDFASKNGVYNAWPFLREAVSSSTSRLGIQPLLLPLLRM